MPVLDGLEFSKRFRVWEEEQQCLLEAQGPLSLPPLHTHIHIPDNPHLTIYLPPSNNIYPQLT